MRYQTIVLPFAFHNFDELNKKQAEKFFQWYTGQINNRIDILKKYIDCEVDGILLDFSPQSLIPLWEWYEQQIVIELKSDEELKYESGISPDWMQSQISERKISEKTLDIGMDIAIYFAEIIRKTAPEKIDWGYFTSPKNQMYVNQPVLLGFRADIPLCPAQIIKVCTWESSEELKKTRLYDAYTKWVQMIGYPTEKRNIMKSYHILLSDIRNTGTLSFKQRKQLWTAFDEIDSLENLQTKEKEIRLALKALLKSVRIHSNTNAFLSEIAMRIDKIMTHLGDIDKVRRFISEANILCDGVLKRQKDFSVLQVQKALETLEQFVECGEYFSDKDTAYYACILWTHQNLKILDNQEQRTEYDFWDWYVREAASIQGVTIEKVMIEEYSDHIKIETIQDFVQSISYEFVYLKYEKNESEKKISIFVFEQKDGGYCPACGYFSDHVYFEFYDILILPKIKGWKLIFDIKKNHYFCDNPNCAKEAFFSESKIDNKEL